MVKVECFVGGVGWRTTNLFPVLHETLRALYTGFGEHGVQTSVRVRFYLLKGSKKLKRNNVSVAFFCKLNKIKAGKKCVN